MLLHLQPLRCLGVHMELTRREFLDVTRGAAAAAVLAGLGLSKPRQAYGIVGVDDAVLGAVVVAMLGLGGYALYDQYSSNLGLQAVGKSFGDYVSVSGNRVAAAQAAAAIAATYGITATQERYETAAQSIADGTGAFAAAMAQAADTGRLALDGLVSGAGDLVGAMRELVAGYSASGAIGEYPQTVPGTTIGGTGVMEYPMQILDISMLQGIVRNLTPPPISGHLVGYYVYNLDNFSGGAGNIYVTTSTVKVYTNVNGGIDVRLGSGDKYVQKLTRKGSRNYIETNGDWTRYTYSSELWTYEPERHKYFASSDVVGAMNLPAVDRPIDAPDVIGAGWDSVPLAQDMVISPTTGGITGAGSIPLPTGIPTTAGDYAAALQGALAGVVPGAIALPQSLSIPVTVATPTGVATMPISEAISTETSLQLDYAPDVPITPVLPPVEIPEGPWTPAVELPFNQLWPFNMIYSVVELFQTLGGS